MGQRQSTRPLPESLYCTISLEILPIQRFKVLNCGHYFCEECLESWARQELFTCPKCRTVETRSVERLPGLHAHNGPLFSEEIPELPEYSIEINSLLHAQMIRRSKTIRILRIVANEVLQVEFTSAGVKIGGSVVGLIATGMVITGTALSLTVVGAVAGVPIAIAGAAVGGVAGLTVGGGIIGEAVAKSKHLNGANEHLQADYFCSMQLRILVGRAATNQNFARRFNLPVQNAASMLGVLGRIAKFGTTTAALAKAIAAGVGRGVANAGLHIAGMVIAAVLIPVDIAQMVVSSIKIHRKDKSEVVKEIESLASVLEDELLHTLKEGGYMLAEIERYDTKANKHSILLAIKETMYDGVVANSNVSIKEIEMNHVIIIDTTGDSIDPDVYSKIIEKWTGIGENEEAGDDETEEEFEEVEVLEEVEIR